MGFIENIKGMFSSSSPAPSPSTRGGVKRVFEVIHVTTRTRQKGIQNTGSILKNQTPLAAARKAANRICRNSKIRGRCALNISLREVLPGGQHGKEYHYHVVRTKREVPTERTLPDGSMVKHVYETVIRKATEEDLLPKPTKQQLKPVHAQMLEEFVRNYKHSPPAHKVKKQQLQHPVLQVDQAEVPVQHIIIPTQKQQVKRQQKQQIIF